MDSLVLSKNFKIISRFFPYLTDQKKIRRLLIDIDSLHYISIREFAIKTCSIISKHLLSLNIKPQLAIITDALSGVGGDCITFAQHFSKVYSIELHKQRYSFLFNNINVFSLSNVHLFNDDCLNILPIIPDHDVVYLDVPWENKNTGSYKKFTNLRLFLNNYSIEDICCNIMNPRIMKKIPSLIVLKLPINYDFDYLTSFFNNNKKKINIYNLNKMFIVVITCN